MSTKKDENKPELYSVIIKIGKSPVGMIEVFAHSSKQAEEMAQGSVNFEAGKVPKKKK